MFLSDSFIKFLFYKIDRFLIVFGSFFCFILIDNTVD
nr:MAG TPA: hypothetical protein [Caudoviricetes sp.]